jgi:spermidine synthase
LAARTSYWCIVRTLEAAGFQVAPYHAPVPSFGVWGYALASPEKRNVPSTIPAELQEKLRFLNERTLHGMFELPEDFTAVPAEINRLDNQVLVRYYEREWDRWN